MARCTLGWLVLAVLLLMPQDGQAQKTFVVPRWQPAANAHDYMDFLIVPSEQSLYDPTHTQVAYDTADFPVDSAQLVSMAFRAARYTDLLGGRTTTDVTLWHAGFAPRSLSGWFAANSGLDAATVFSGTIDWPPRKTWEQPVFVVALPFLRPFTLLKSRGKSLVVDVKSRLMTAVGWHVAAAAPDLGRFDFNYRGDCWLIRHVSYYGGGVGRERAPGGSLAFSWYNIPPNASCLASIGLVGIGGKWGNLTLPIDLGAGCPWSVASLLFWPFSTDGLGNGQAPPLPIPPDPKLSGMQIFEQSMCFAPNLNSIGLVTFFSTRVFLGSGDRPNAKSIHAYKDSPPRAGAQHIADETAPLIQFTYQ